MAQYWAISLNPVKTGRTVVRFPFHFKAVLIWTGYGVRFDTQTSALYLNNTLRVCTSYLVLLHVPGSNPQRYSHLSNCLGPKYEEVCLLAL
jgi:hypothetical protein